MSETNVVYVPNTAVNGETNTNGASAPEEKERTIRLHVSQDRMEQVKVGVWRKLEEAAGLSGMADLVEFFLWNGHSYLSKEEARTITNEMTTAELKEASTHLMDLAKNAVASPQ